MSLLLLFNQPPFFEKLLRAAERLRGEREPAIAVVTAHMAFEVAAEQAFSRLLRTRGVGELEEPLVNLLTDRTFMDRRTRDLWAALTGGDIKTADGWKEYSRSVEVRNRAVHGQGDKIADADADASVDAVTRVMRHIVAETKRVADAA